MTSLRPAIFPPGIIAAFSTRNGGVSPPPLGLNLSFRVGDDPANVVRNRGIFYGGLGIPLASLAIPGQVHGKSLLKVDAPGEYPGIDALITLKQGLYLCVSIADCVPVLLFDPLRGAIAAVHAGWRGTVAGITASAVESMCAEFGSLPSGILASIGPCASSCCYNVGDEVASRLPAAFVRTVGAETFVDLKGANRDQLLKAGLRPENVELSPYCTISDSLLFHSFRRDGVKSGRMMAVIGQIA